METEKRNFFDETKDLVATYVEDRILLLKLQAAEKAAEISSSLFKGILVATLLFFIITILSFVAGYYLSHWTGSIFYGFGILALIYFVLLLLIMYLHKKYFNKYIVDKVIVMFFQNKEA